MTASKGKTPTDDREHEQPGPDKPAAYVAGWHDGWAVGYQAGRQRREHSYDEPDKTAA